MGEEAISSPAAPAVPGEETPGLPVGPEEAFDARWETLVGGWLAQYSPSTAAAYSSDLRAWVAWAVPRGLTLTTVGPGEVGEWARALEAVGRRPAGVARKLAALSSFYDWVVGEGVVPRSPLDRVRRPRVRDDSQRLGLERGDAARLLAAAQAASARDHALICLLLLNGLRVSEACGAQVEDLGESRGHVTLRILRKGAREATVPLAPRSATAVAAARVGRDHGALLLDWEGRPLDRHDATRILRRLSRAAGIPPCSPHGLRHAFVTAALDSGATLRDVQDAAGHADPRTTRRYDRSRYNLDRHPTYAVAGWLSGPPADRGGAEEEGPR